MTKQFDNIFLERIANALERISPPPLINRDLNSADGYVFDAKNFYLKPIKQINRIPLKLLKGIEFQKEILIDNTINFANNFPANNALLWGAKGTGKSSLIKSVHLEISKKYNHLKLIEIHREDILELPRLLSILSELNSYQCILLCDDLSFDQGENSYKSLKSVLDGGIEGKPKNIIFYATSNRRHLMPREMIDNEKSTSISPSEATEEKVSLSDRFGIWIGFHNISQEVYIDMIMSYAKNYNIKLKHNEMKAKALEWSITRGSRSGRVAWQFIQQIAGETKTSIK